MSEENKELFAENVKVIDEEVKEQEPKPSVEESKEKESGYVSSEDRSNLKYFTKKGKRRKVNKDGQPRKAQVWSEEKKAKMQKVLADAREKARVVRIKKGVVSRQKKEKETSQKAKQLEEEYLSAISQKNNVNEIADLKKELAEMKELLMATRKKPKDTPPPKVEEKEITTQVAPVSPVVVPKEPDPVVPVSQPVLPTEPKITRKSLRPKSVWSKFV